ncbi:MAG: DivIVA domain-containing protein [Candidatus Humimicrobiaceae bacterium]
MNINSEYIQKKEFHTAFKGYNMEEVDKFLDIIAVEFERITKKNKELQDGLDKVKYEGDAQQETDVSKLISEVLVSAHKVADEIRKKAETEAEEIIQSKKSIEENELKDLLEEKKELEQKVKFAGNFYGDFILKVKNVINDFNLKISNIENEFKAEDLNKKLKSDKEEVKEIKSDYEKPAISDFNLDNKKSIIDENKKGFHTLDEEPGNVINPEIKKLSDEEEEQKIREIIESKDVEEVRKDNFSRDTKKEKKIFDDYEEKKIIRERKKIDIGNPDIINEFFGNNEERKY